jgi:RNA polymerase sigma-70 factor, ECF subfamily
VPEADSPAGPASLVHAARRGDAEAFAELYRRFGRFVHGLLLARLPPDDAADVAQDVFTQAWMRLDTLDEPAAFGGWIAAIARRRAVDHLRRQHVHARLDESIAAPATHAAAVEAHEILDVIRALPTAYRETLVLRLVEGLSGSEIAALTGLTPASVRVNLHRGFKLLRERLGVSA